MSPNDGRDSNKADMKINLYDPKVEDYMDKEARDWKPEDYPCLWPRVLTLEEFQRDAKPWSIWVLFRDRRDTGQWWALL